MTTLAVSGNASGVGAFTLTSPSSASTRTVTLPDATTTLVGTDATQTLTNKTIQGGAITSSTAVASTSGTSIDFTSIPSWVKRITVMFNGVSTNGTSNVQCQIGTSDGVQNTSYVSNTTTLQNAASPASTSVTTGFGLCANMAGGVTLQGAFRIQLLDVSTGIWAVDGTLNRSDAPANYVFSGVKTLSGTLDRLRITTVGGTNIFDAGSINILYE